MAKTSPSARRTALIASAVAVLGALTACGAAGGTASAAPSGTAGRPSGTAGTSAGRSAPPAGAVPGDTAASASASGRTGDRCHTAQLRASVGRDDPGAGQRNFPVVLTNVSQRACTVHGYPGAAFVDASGRQLGPDPVRTPASPVTLTLAPGASAWSGLSFSSPRISGARTAIPASLLVTPPDERDSLTVRWTGGEVPVGGNASAVRLGPLEAGTGP
ncbi:DUF4232 domain-containing protein [Streptomyces tagetis]|uniref:DUF4232 domain-containing protein n=1 Tax=Streptomyces tagetis TaxID=2820809 RepID=A0A940XKN8_9ACTN|nr:DUF4232 domain-containing protein [Streptomyces sp. RG38]MBQ0826274.1 DUF4232 domain-containing protein [Streptomyces sp. RG38]